MTTTLERLATEPKHNPDLLVPNVYDDNLRRTEALCPCGNTASVRDGRLNIHSPAQVWDMDGRGHALITDAYAVGVRWRGCRYTGRTATLAAALERDNVLTDAEQRVRDVTLSRLEAGITEKAPEGYALPKAGAGLFALAEAKGWTVQQAWVPDRDRDMDELYGYSVWCRIGRTDDEGFPWSYDLGWYLAPGVARRKRGALCRTPENRTRHPVPSLKAITTVIAANPVEG